MQTRQLSDDEGPLDALTLVEVRALITHKYKLVHQKRKEDKKRERKGLPLLSRES